jgi:hypothetical protein
LPPLPANAQTSIFPPPFFKPDLNILFEFDLNLSHTGRPDEEVPEGAGGHQAHQGVHRVLR